MRKALERLTKTHSTASFNLKFWAYSLPPYKFERLKNVTFRGKTVEQLILTNFMFCGVENSSPLPPLIKFTAFKFSEIIAQTSQEVSEQKLFTTNPFNFNETFGNHQAEHCSRALRRGLTRP